jgi:hypothetical protein
MKKALYAEAVRNGHLRTCLLPEEFCLGCYLPVVCHADMHLLLFSRFQLLKFFFSVFFFGIPNSVF